MPESSDCVANEKEEIYSKCIKTSPSLRFLHSERPGGLPERHRARFLRLRFGLWYSCISKTRKCTSFQKPKDSVEQFLYVVGHFDPITGRIEGIKVSEPLCAPIEVPLDKTLFGLRKDKPVSEHGSDRIIILSHFFCRVLQRQGHS
jgi:hypothetical protein